MLVNKENGSLVLDDGYIFYPNLSFAVFANSKYFEYGNKIERLLWLRAPQIVGERLFYVGLMFDDVGLFQIKLKFVSQKFMEPDEYKLLHDKILVNEGLNDEFDWGRVKSVFDSKSNLCTININYRESLAGL